MKGEVSHRDQPEAGLAAVSGLLSHLVTRAEDLSQTRCPYRNRLDCCTAEFGCPNQRKAERPGYLPACRGDLYLNYLSSGSRP